MDIVIFTGGDASDPSLASAFLSTIQPALRVAADSGLDTLERYNRHFHGMIDFSPDVILGDMDSLADRSLLTSFPNAKVETFPKDKDYTDTELALKTARSFSSDARLILIGGAGGRVDHLLGIYDTFSSDCHPDVWLCGEQMLVLLQKNQVYSVTGLGATDPVSIARVNGSRSGGSIRTHGLEWEWDKFRKNGMPSISNRISESYGARHEPVTIEVKDDGFILIVPITAAVTDLRK